MKKALNSLKNALTSLKTTFEVSREIDEYEHGVPITPKDVYNYSEGMNAGAFTIRKPLENITADDVLNAYELEDLFAGVPIKSETWSNLSSEYTRTDNPSKFIWTASGAQLIYAGIEMMTNTNFKTRCDCFEGDYTVSISNNALQLIRNKLGSSAAATMRNVGAYNLKVLQGLPENCVGLKLDRVYPVYAKGYFTSKTSCFYPKCDFLIDGEDSNGNIAGGFMFRYGGLCAEHSLVLRKVHIMKRDNQYSGIVIFAQNGIEQVQVLDSLFDRIGSSSMRTDTREGHGYAGDYISVVFDNKNPIANEQFTETNRIKHILVKGNTAYGYEFFHNSSKGSSKNVDTIPARSFISDSCRFINNTIYGGDAEDNLFAGYNYSSLKGYCGTLIGFGTDNDSVQATRMGYNSCPMWFVGNEFYGAERVIASRFGDRVMYHAGVLLECGQGFFIKNTFANFMTKKTYTMKFHYTDDDKKEATSATEIRAGKCPATYDTYGNVTRLWWVNNTIRNIAVFSLTKRDDEGLFKAKGKGMPSEASKDWGYKVIRYISGNTVTLDMDWLRQKWEEATIGKYDTDGKDAYYPYKKSDNDFNSYYGVTKKNSGEHQDWTPSGWRIEDLTRDGQVRTAADHQDLQVGILKDDLPYLWGEKHCDRLLERYFDDYVTVKFPSMLESGNEYNHYNPQPALDFTFKNNVFNMGRGCLGSMASISHLYCVHFTCEGNIFNARRVISNRWSIHRNMVDESGSNFFSRDFLFDIVAMDMYNCTYDTQTNTIVKDPNYAPTVTIRNNKFNITDYEEEGNVLPTYVDFARISYDYKRCRVYEDLGISRSATEKINSNRLKISNNTVTNPTAGNKVVVIQEKYSGNAANGSTTDVHDATTGALSALTLSDIIYPFPSQELLEEE